MAQSKEIERNEQIYQLSTLVAGAFSLQEVLDKLAEAAVKITGVKACSIRLLDDQAGDLKMRSTYGLSEEYRRSGTVTKDDPVIKAAFTGQPVVVDDMQVDPRVTKRQEVIKEGLVSQLTVAMQFRGESIGVLRLYRPQLKGFDHNDIALARAVASQCALAITNAKLYAEAIEGERMAEQVRLAGVIQRQMLPHKAPLVPGLDIDAAYKPCFDVGGDFYDFLQVTDHGLSVVIADVIGKGMPAALMMSMFRGTLRGLAHAGQKTHTVAEIIDELNKTACAECKNSEFVTLFFANIDVRQMAMTYCNCGHEPTLLFRRDNIMELNKGGLVLGVLPDAAYEIDTLTLQDGDCLLFYTDGLIDAANFSGDLWGKDRLLETARRFTPGSARNMVRNILRYRARFAGLLAPLDDTTLVVVKVDRRAQPQFMEEVDF